MCVINWFCKFKLILITATVLFFATGTLLAIDVELTLLNDKIIYGELVSENKQAVTLKIMGIETHYKRDQIKSIKKLLTLAEQYESKKAQLKEDDLEGRYKLASWLYNKQAYDLAEKEILSLQKAFPKDNRIPLLLRLVKSKRTLIKANESTSAVKPPAVSQQTPQTSTEQPADLPSRYTSKKVGEQNNLLTDEQINLIKVYEVNLSNKPNIRFKRQDLEDFLEAYQGQEYVPDNRSRKNDFLNKKSGYQQLEVLFKTHARDFYSKATILGDPEAFKNFKIIHRTYILNRCATSACHGGENAQGIYLFNRRPGASADQIVYTNFYILNSYSASKSGTQYDMIDRSETDRSLLLQFGLPRDEAVFAHPPVRGMRPAFNRAKEDRQYKMVSDWIKSLYSPAPDYGIDYQLSGEKVTLPDSTSQEEKQE